MSSEIDGVIRVSVDLTSAVKTAIEKVVVVEMSKHQEMWIGTMERIDRLAIKQQSDTPSGLCDFDLGWNRALEVLAVTSEEVLNPMSEKSLRIRVALDALSAKNIRMRQV